MTILLHFYYARKQLLL